MSEAMAIGNPAVRARDERGRLTAAWRVAVKEVTDLYRDGRVWCAAVVAVLLMLASATLSWQDYEARETARVQAEQTARQQWEGQGEKDAHSAAHFGQYAFTPETVLAAIDPGTRAHTGSAVWLEPHRRNMFRFKPGEDIGAAVRYGVLTPAFVLQVVIPLLLISFCFSSVAAEREAGTLRLLFSLGLTPTQLFVGKAAGIFLAAAPVLTLLLVALAVLGAVGLGADLAGGGDAVRLLLMVPVYGVYWSIWVFVGLGVSCRARSAQQALTVLLALWVAATLFAPRIGSLLAEQLAPPLSGQVFGDGIRDDLEKGLDGNSPPEQRYQEFVRKTLEEYGVTSLAEVPVGVAGLRLRSGDAYSEQVHDKYFDALHENWQQQARFALLASLGGPLPTMRALSQSLAGTDIEHHIHFSQAAEMYRREFINRTSDEVTRTARGTGGRPKAGPELWHAIEPFEYQRPTVGAALRDQQWSLLLLAAWLVTGVAFAYRSFRTITFG